MPGIDWLARIEAGLGLDAGFFRAASSATPAAQDGCGHPAAEAASGLDPAMETRLLQAFRRIVDQGLRLRILEMVEECAARGPALPRRS